MNTELDNQTGAEQRPAEANRREPEIDVHVTVNNKPVTIHHHEATGAQIKTAAISQHVDIKPDFVLFIVERNDDLEQVADDNTVHLHEHEHFRACAPDDNS